MAKNDSKILIKSNITNINQYYKGKGRPQLKTIIKNFGDAEGGVPA